LFFELLRINRQKPLIVWLPGRRKTQELSHSRSILLPLGYSMQGCTCRCTGQLFRFRQLSPSSFQAKPWRKLACLARSGALFSEVSWWWLRLHDPRNPTRGAFVTESRLFRNEQFKALGPPTGVEHCFELYLTEHCFGLSAGMHPILDFLHFKAVRW